MKNLLFFTILLFTSFSMAQTVITKNVSHSNEISGMTVSGCCKVKMNIVYTLSGNQYTVSSSNVTLDNNTSTSLSATVPAGAVINSKTLVISTKNLTYNYSIVDASNSANSCGSLKCCPTASYTGKCILVSETSSLITFWIDGTLG